MSSSINRFKTNLILFFLSLIVTYTAMNCHNSLAESNKIPDEIDYNYHIRPILSDRCFKCHGPDINKREANLRLDTPEGAFAALKDNPKAHALVSKNLELSVLYSRITSKDTSEMMPPPESNLKLSEYEIDLIAKWIKQGAKYKPHWAFIPPHKSKLPEVENYWAKNEIDHFKKQIHRETK